MTTIVCPWCDTRCPGTRKTQRFSVRCDVCGHYELHGYAEPGDAAVGLTPMQRASLSHYARTKWEIYESRPARGLGRERSDVGAIINRDVVDLARRSQLLVSRARQADNAIKYIGDRVQEQGPPASIPWRPASFAAVIGAPDQQSAGALMSELSEGKFVSWDIPATSGTPMAVADLTLAGWERYEAMTHGSHGGGYGFFAWQFESRETKRVFERVLKPKFEDLGCPLKDLSDLSRPGVIDNIMRERIRNAAYVIVDLTDHNLGAYWEGGFAEALGKAVVYIMERTAFRKKKPHFDTNHCTIVFWGGEEADEEFVEKLVATLRQHPGEVGF